MAIQNRRDFLKNISLLSICLGVDAPLSPFLELASDSEELSETALLFNNERFVWWNTIFCQFDKLELTELSKEIEELAENIGCKIFYGEPSSPDIIAVPHFIEIVDRNNLGENGWKDYLICCEEATDDIPCLIIDSRDDLKLPKNKYVKRFNPSDFSKRLPALLGIFIYFKNAIKV